MPHDEDNPVPLPPAAADIESDDGSDYTDDTRLYEPAEFKSVKHPHLINQEELNDLVRDLELSRQKVKSLGSCLQEWNLLAEGTQIEFL